MKPEIRNLTGHPVVLKGADSEYVEIPPDSIGKSWLETEDSIEATIDVGGVSINVTRISNAGIVGLPPFQPGVLLLVSKYVIMESNRGDLITPFKLVRNQKGDVVSAGGVRMNERSRSLWIR